MSAITISKKKVKKEGGVVILSLEEYRKLSERAGPSYYLKGKAAKNLDLEIKEALREEKRGNTKILKSLADLD